MKFPSPFGELSIYTTSHTLTAGAAAIPVSVPFRGTIYLYVCCTPRQLSTRLRGFRPLSGNYLFIRKRHNRGVVHSLSFRPLSGNYLFIQPLKKWLTAQSYGEFPSPFGELSIYTKKEARRYSQLKAFPSPFGELSIYTI